MSGTDTEERASYSAKWSGEDMEESELEREAETAGGEGKAGTTPTPTTDRPEGSGEKTGLGGAAAGEGATSDATTRRLWNQTQWEQEATMRLKISKGVGLSTGR